MNIIISNSSNAIQTSFKKLEFTDNGLILECKKDKKKAIAFEEIETVYMKSHSMHPIVELALMLTPFLSLLMIVDYIAFPMLLILAIVSIIPIVTKIINYKWYSLQVRLKDGSLFIKKVSSSHKTDYFSLINKYCKDSHYYFSNRFASAS
jgi:hypothetical protein